MSEETYVIAKEGEGEELDVIKVICTKCEAFEYMSPEEAAKVNDSSFRCSVCSNQKLVKSYVKCAACGTTMDPKTMKCWCPEVNKPLLTWYSKDSTNKRLNEEIDESKMQGLERKIVRNAKQEKLDREIRMDSNLQKLVDILLEKEK